MNRAHRVIIITIGGLLLAWPVSAHAMIELLPTFFAVTGILIVMAVVPVSVFLKRFLMHWWLDQFTVVSWKNLCLVALVETMIMTCSLLLFFVSMESYLMSRGPVQVLSAIFAGSSLLYCVLAMMPNLWLLHRMFPQPDGSGQPRRRDAFALLLTLPTPFVLILFSLVLALLALS